MTNSSADELRLPPSATARPNQRISQVKARRKLALFGVLGLASMGTACVPVNGAVGPGVPSEVSTETPVVDETIVEVDDSIDGLEDQVYVDDHEADNREEGFYDQEADLAEQRYIDAFFEAGYDYDYAIELADHWGYQTPYDAKITKGKVLLEDAPFPPPANQPEFAPEQLYVDAFFEAGYDYDYAIELADYWGYQTPYDAKITKGKVLLGEIDYPQPANQDGHIEDAPFPPPANQDDHIEDAPFPPPANQDDHTEDAPFPPPANQDDHTEEDYIQESVEEVDDFDT